MYSTATRYDYNKDGNGPYKIGATKIQLKP